MEDSQVKLDSNCSASIRENDAQVQKKKEETLRSGIHNYVHGCVCVLRPDCKLWTVSKRADGLENKLACSKTGHNQCMSFSILPKK